MSGFGTTQGVSNQRELTGRAVFIWFVGFFLLVFAANAALVRLATSTFGGVETSSSYKAGLAFKQDIAAAEQQDALHWQVTGNVARTSAGDVTLDLVVRDATGGTVPGWTAVARLSHPVDSRQDQPFAMRRTGHETARGTAHADAGQWNVLIDLDRDGVRVFRSRSRIVLR
jgi:nitrogen fixation protein FixH